MKKIIEEGKTHYLNAKEYKTILKNNNILTL